MVTIKKLKTIEEYKDFIKTDVSIVKLSAAWCGPCRTLGQNIANSDIEARIGEIDVDEECFEDLCTHLNIRGIPVLIYYKDGVEKDRTVGAVSVDDIKKRVENIC